jgi:solute carrier family 66 (lysosomal lysine-arginine transporter), member 1
MAETTFFASRAPSLPPHCTPTTPFLLDVSTYFNSCIPTPQAFLSTLLGSLSIVSWLFAQMPQIYKNYQIKSTAGLSIFFLAEWLLGDATNLLGALFTKQATWQIIIATYYVFVDICLVFQYFWYTYMTRRVYGESLHSSGSSIRSDGDSDIISGLSPINTSFRDDDASNFKDDDNRSPQKTSETEPIDAPRFTTVNYQKSNSPAGSLHLGEKFGASWMASPRTLLLATTVASLASSSRAAPVPFPDDHYAHGLHLLRIETPLEIAGTIISWCSTLLYLGSRLPQLYKNFRRQSTTGLSPLLFFAAFCGNLFYSSSMLTNPNAWHDFGPHGGHGWAGEDGSQQLAWIARAAPFFLGAAGVLGLDGMMGVQFLMYGEKEEKVIKVRDGRGYSHWEKVNGWMRGWIPTVAGKEKVVDLAESQRLLAQSHHMSMSRRSTREYGTMLA